MFKQETRQKSINNFRENQGKFNQTIIIANK